MPEGSGSTQPVPLQPGKAWGNLHPNGSRRSPDSDQRQHAPAGPRFGCKRTHSPSASRSSSSRGMPSCSFFQAHSPGGMQASSGVAVYPDSRRRTTGWPKPAKLVPAACALLDGASSRVPRAVVGGPGGEGAHYERCHWAVCAPARGSADRQSPSHAAGWWATNESRRVMRAAWAVGVRHRARSHRMRFQCCARLAPGIGHEAASSAGPCCSWQHATLPRWYSTVGDDPKRSGSAPQDGHGKGNGRRSRHHAALQILLQCSPSRPCKRPLPGNAAFAWPPDMLEWYSNTTVRPVRPPCSLVASSKDSWRSLLGACHALRGILARFGSCVPGHVPFRLDGCSCQLAVS